MIRKRGHIDPIEDQRRISRAIERELTMIGLEIEKTAVEYLDRKNINVDGDLRDSINSKVEREVRSMILQIGANSDHAVYVHDGTKPHWPPYWPILRWVLKKLNIKGPPAKRVTFLVRRKIARKGTKAKPFLATAFRAHKNKIAGRIADAVARAA